jgi:hypothetical protein
LMAAAFAAMVDIEGWHIAARIALPSVAVGGLTFALVGMVQLRRAEDREKGKTEKRLP